MKFAKCPCSRCKLYLSQLSDGADKDAQVEKTNFFEHREYQHYLLELAKNRNIIACLPTGSGKTFIAYKLIEHFKDDLLNKHKKVFFLANTIPLVNQQAAFFARHTILSVKHITGDMEVDYWTEEKWQNIIDLVNVMAMTAQIFLNLIRHGYIKFSRVALIIFDECHHAVKEHPMNQIMREYDRTKKADDKYTMPRILGLTATIIKGNCKPNEVPERVADLENIMDADAVTYKDYEEVMKNSTNAVVDSVSVDNIKQSEWYPPFLLEEIKVLSSNLQVYRKERQKLKAALAKIPIDGIHSSLRNSNCLYLTYKKPSPGDLKTAVDDVRHAYEELGPYCAVIAINLRLAFINFSLMDLHPGGVRDWYGKVKEFFLKMRERLTDIMAGRKENERVYYYISPKLKKLIDIIYQFRPSQSHFDTGDDQNKDDESLCGLVFVDRRATAQVIAWYFKDLAELTLSPETNSSDTGMDMNTDKKFYFIRANFVVGTSRCPFETVESRVYAKKQTETINQ